MFVIRELAFVSKGFAGESFRTYENQKRQSIDCLILLPVPLPDSFSNIFMPDLNAIWKMRWFIPRS